MNGNKSVLPEVGKDTYYIRGLSVIVRYCIVMQNESFKKRIGTSSEPNNFVSCRCLIVNIMVLGSTGLGRSND